MEIIDQATLFFAEHHTSRKVAYALIFGFAGVVATAGLAFVGALNDTAYVWAIPILTALFLGLQNWATHQEKLPILNAMLATKAKPKPQRKR